MKIGCGEHAVNYPESRVIGGMLSFARVDGPLPVGLDTLYDRHGNRWWLTTVGIQSQNQ